MRGLCWVHIKYIYYYEQYTHTPWLTLPDAVAVCTFRGNAPERGKSDENRYILRNKANKSFRINTNEWEEVQKATRKRNEIR